MISFRSGAKLATTVAAWMLVSGAVPAKEAQPTTTAPARKKQPVVVIEGQVVDSMGAGVKDVKVIAKRKKGDGELEYLNTAATNEMGDFAILGFPPLRGTAVVTMTKWGFKEFSTDVELVPGELPPFVDVQLGGAVVVFGIVSDARTGAGIGGARIKVEARFVTWDGVSEEDGKFRVPGVPPGPGIVTVDAKGFGRVQHRVQRLEDFGELILPLEPERIVHIRTVDDHGRPVTGVNVECFSKTPNDFRSEVSDDQGRIVLRGVNRETAKFLARVSREGYVASASYDREVVLPEDQTESHHTLRLSPAGSIKGTVVDARTGDPLNGARVAVGEGLVDVLPRSFSDFAGAYQVDGIAAGKTPVTVHLAGHAPELETVTIEPGKQLGVNFKLAPGQTVSGVVVDSAGEPVADAYIHTTRWREHETLGLQAITDDKGRFTIDSAPADEFTIEIWYDRRVVIDGTTVQGGKTDYRYELKKPSGAEQPGKLKVGEDAPPLNLVTLDGTKLTPADLKSKWVFLNFWATWCGPCRVEIPHLKAVHDAYGKRDDFALINISLDSDKTALQKFIAEKSLGGLHVFGEESGAAKAIKDYGALAIPLHVIIDPTGKIVAVDVYGREMKAALDRVSNGSRDRE